jgi:phosphatidylglycerophosphate synthase
VTESETGTGARAGARRSPAPVGAGSTAVLVATAVGAGGRPAAAQSWEGTSVVGRLVAQLASLGVDSVHVLTRPASKAAVEAALDGSVRVEVHSSERAVDDLRAIGRLAAAAQGALVIAYADVVTQREALAGLLADARVGTGILSAGGSIAEPFAVPIRARRGRIVSAGSPYHAVHDPTGRFLGVLKVARADRRAVAEVAERLARLVEPGPPADWEDELERRRAIAPDDVTALLLVGLVRAGVHVTATPLRTLFWARPLSPAALESAAAQIHEHDEGEARLDASVKGSDGFFTTFFVSPYSKYIARWAAHRGLTPNQVTLSSLAVGLLAAAAFATGERPGLVGGAILLQLAFVLDCVDGQLARYTRNFSKLGAWLDSILDRTKEYLVFAGLAIGASRAGDPVWLLAGAMLALQTARHMIDFTYPTAQEQMVAVAPQPPIEASSDRAEVPSVSGVRPRSTRRRLISLWLAGDRSPTVVWAKKVIALPIGERFAAISLTAALSSPRTVFVVLLVWGGFAAVYVSIGRTLRSLAA